LHVNFSAANFKIKSKSNTTGASSSEDAGAGVPGLVHAHVEKAFGIVLQMLYDDSIITNTIKVCLHLTKAQDVESVAEERGSLRPFDESSK
jgi:hypothetical protein